MKTIQRHIPANSERLEHPQGFGIVYLYGPEQRFAMAYKGRAGRSSWNYSHKDRKQAEKHAQEWFDSLTGWQKRKSEWRAEANQPHTLQKDDIVYNSWGYDQTNIDWFQVVRMTDHFVWLRPIAANVRETSFMAGPTIPKPNHFLSEEVTKHKATTNATGTHVVFRHGSGSKWEGQALHCSWYA
jgi:hypothetical protein